MNRLILLFTVGFSLSVFAQSETEQEESIDWGAWDKPVTEIELSELPLSSEQKAILQEKINQLKNAYGVGIIGDIERAITELDKSSLNETPTQPSEVKLKSNRQIFLDDMQLEQEIIELEFASNANNADPEGLTRSGQTNQQLFKMLMDRLNKLAQTTNNTKPASR